MALRYLAQEEPAPLAEPPIWQSVEALEQLLDVGWRIDLPVLTRLSWSQRRTGELAYHFILAYDSRRSLVVIAESPDLHRFLAERSLPVT